ncbi:MAG: HEAT repeat domain-containing protein [Candidatus Shapirobacteria bacterium]|nr:HEAT repeat domain-containing protein [Candidatus Shapirobacteria bacterium]MDD5481944.1 HEAT repeat domain-containing protein [Candidatus Shapirobacteria bacterium]
MMKTKNIKQALLYLLAIGISILVLFFVIGASWIGYEVKSQCRNAQRDYGDGLSADEADCVDALVSLLKDESRGFRARNSAIWALGQLGDARALPVLKSFYTGNIPDREPLDKMISQYELKKAINLTSGGINIAALIWRVGHGN